MRRECRGKCRYGDIMHAGSSGAGGRIDLEVALDSYARCCGIPVCFPRKIGRHVHVHVHVNLPSRQDAQPQVPWRHNVGGAEKLVGIFMIPNLPGLQLPASSKRHHVHVHGKLPSHVAISAKRTTTGPVETQRGQNVEGQGARGRREGADMRHAGIHLQRTT